MLNAKKRFLAIFLLLCVLIIIMVSCVASSPLSFGYEKTVVAVDLIKYDNPDARENPSKSYALDVDKIEFLEKLDLDATELQEFAQKTCIRVHSSIIRKQYLFSHDGIGIKILYDDDSFQIITLTEIDGTSYFFVAIYTADCEVINSKDVCMDYVTESFKELINSYFTTQI